MTTQKSITIHYKTYAPTKSAQMRKINDWRLPTSLFYEPDGKIWKYHILQTKPILIKPLHQSTGIYQIFWYL